MRVNVDKARTHDTAVGLEGLTRPTRQGTDRDHAAVANAQIGAPPRMAMS